MNCAATGPITVRIEQLSPVANGYIKLVLLNVAGSNGISSVAIAPAGTQVSFAAHDAEHCSCLRQTEHTSSCPSDVQIHDAPESVFRDSADNAEAPKYSCFNVSQMKLHFPSCRPSQKQAALLLLLLFWEQISTSQTPAQLSLLLHISVVTLLPRKILQNYYLSVCCQVFLMLMQNFVQLKNTYGAVWEGSIPTAPPLDLQISSSGQQLVLRYRAC